MTNTQTQNNELLLDLIKSINENWPIRAHIAGGDLHLVIGDFHYSVFSPTGMLLIHKDIN